MGHRALIAYRQREGGFNLHFSGWGADVDMAGRITPATPFGGANDMAPPAAGAFTAALADGVDADVQVARHMTDADDTPIEPDPIEIGVGIDDVIDKLDTAWYEMLFVVDPVYDDEADELVDMDVRAFRVLRDLAGEYILAEPDRSFGRYIDDAYKRGWYQGVKDQCEALVDHDVVDEETANQRLHEAVLEKYADQLAPRLLGRSPAFTADERAEYPCAFLRMSGLSRVMGEMYPTGIHDPAPWELPDDFPSVKTAEGERVEVA